ncbi:histidinol-phosphate transaminase [Chitinophaga caeni]|nr:histidinol-phosphate transaminase [Chitinophaga caeni]
MFNLDNLLRDNIKRLVPYSSARDEFKGEASIFLDANENSFGSPLAKAYNRYPDPMQWKIKYKLAEIKGVPPQNIFLGNGSDEAIDILYRAFCRPGIDNVILCPPTYGMYEVSANINDVTIRKVSLAENFQLDLAALETAIDENTKMIFLCSPNNPTGNDLDREDIEAVLNNFDGIVVIDEAYINFSKQRSFIQELTEYPNLVVLQTLSKAWGLAALRLGMAFASEDIIHVFNKIKPPYNIGQATQDLVLEALEGISQVNDWIKTAVSEREKLVAELALLPVTENIYPSDANFFLMKTKDAKGIYNSLVEQGIIVRDRSKVEMCAGCLRITVGTKEENEALLNGLKSYTPVV